MTNVNNAVQFVFTKRESEKKERLPSDAMVRLGCVLGIVGFPMKTNHH